MAIRVARQIWRVAFAAVLIAAAETAVLAQTPPPAETGGMPPPKPLSETSGITAPNPIAGEMPIAVPQPMSPQCAVPSATIASPVPLPNLTAALMDHKEIRVLAIGSSSTYGVGATMRSRNYPAQFADILQHALKGTQVEIVNRGVGGEVAATTAERLRSEVALARPDLVLWQLGTNDALARVSVEDFDKIVRATLAWLKDNKIDVVLVGLQYTPKMARDDNYIAIRDQLFKIAAEENVLYVRRGNAMQFIEQSRNTTLVSGDDLHLNDTGYRCMAEHVAQAVIANLFLRRFRPATN